MGGDRAYFCRGHHLPLPSGFLWILAECWDERMAWKFPGTGQGMEGSPEALPPVKGTPSLLVPLGPFFLW